MLQRLGWAGQGCERLSAALWLQHGRDCNAETRGLTTAGNTETLRYTVCKSLFTTRLQDKKPAWPRLSLSHSVPLFFGGKFVLQGEFCGFENV